jgi:hypothetical protein
VHHSSKQPGGEEETRARGALVAAERVEQAVRASGAGALRAGIAEAGPGIDRHELFRNAYCALLAAGDSGRPRTLAYSPELERRPGAGTFAGLAEVEPIRGSHRAHR